MDRARAGSKHHVITDAGGIPLAATLTGGNRHDVTQLLSLIEAIPPVRGRCGRPRQRPVQVFADRAYDHNKYRVLVRARASSRSSPSAAPATGPAADGTGG